MNFPQINITDIEHQQVVREAARAARMTIINNFDQESREKLKKQEVQVYKRKNPKQPTTDQPKPPPLEVLLPRTSKTGEVDLNFDFEGALSKMHVNDPLREVIKIPSIKEHFDTFFSGSDEPMDTPVGPILLFFHQNCLVSNSNIHHHWPGLVLEKTLAP